MAVRSIDSARMGLRMDMWATRGEQRSGSGSCVGCRFVLYEALTMYRDLKLKKLAGDLTEQIIDLHMREKK